MKTLDKKNFDWKYLGAALFLLCCLLAAAFWQMSPPECKVKPPDFYLGNMILVNDQLCNEAFQGSRDALELFLQHNSSQEEAVIWKQWKAELPPSWIK